MTGPDVDLGTRLHALDRAVVRADAKREALAARRALLEREVGLAKGRLALKPRVEEFLQKFQEESSRRNVEKYEGLLNALVDEIFPDQRGEKRRVVLELSTERGLPSLDLAVEADSKRDEREDVLEDNGGALTNVISTGLRLIAAVKSGTRPFLVLDEPDCWIESSRVTSFYDVLRDAADKLGVQCLAISHHKILSTEGGIHSATLQGFPKNGGVRIAAAGPVPEWPPGRDAFRYIRLVDIQGYQDVRVDLAHGVTAITGPNGRGKSTITRAWRAVFYGEAKASIVRHGCKVGTVEVGCHDGRFLRYSRARKRNPVNLWSYHEADGEIVEESGVRYESGGNAVPDWVALKFGVSRVEGLDVHLSHQKFPIFLLGETASKRASVLSIGQEASYVQDMLAIYRERCSKDQSLVREGEKEAAAIDGGLSQMAGLPALAAKVDELGVAWRDIAEARVAAASSETVAARLADAGAALLRARTKRSSFDGLPDRTAFAALERTIAGAQLLERIADTAFATADRLRAARGRAQALRDLPASAPRPKDTERMLLVGRGVKDARAALALGRAKNEAYAPLPTTLPSLRDERESVALAIEGAGEGWRAAVARLDAANAGIKDVKVRVAAIVADGGGGCPTCGKHVDDPSALLEDHL